MAWVLCVITQVPVFVMANNASGTIAKALTRGTWLRFFRSGVCFAFLLHFSFGVRKAFSTIRKFGKFLAKIK